MRLITMYLFDALGQGAYRAGMRLLRTGRITLTGGGLFAPRRRVRAWLMLAVHLLDVAACLDPASKRKHLRRP